MAYRYYTIDGKKVPSVTSILNVLNKPQLVNWAARITRDFIKQELFAFRRADSFRDLDLDNLLAKSAKEHDRVRTAAADHGIAVHSSIASYVGDKSNITHNDPVIIGFREWQESSQFVPIASERLVFSHEHGFAGTADLIGTLNGRLALLDIKTGRGVYPEYKLQLAAYAVAWGEMGGHFPEVCMNLHVKSDFTITEANSFTATELFPLFQTFLAAKRLFEWQSEQLTVNQRRLVSKGQKVAASMQQ
jgi:PD-(D/E)XK nuclease superfamily